jgi:hypothetical protein
MRKPAPSLSDIEDDLGVNLTPVFKRFGFRSKPLLMILKLKIFKQLIACFPLI